MNADRPSTTPAAVTSAPTHRDPVVPATRTDIAFLSGIVATGTLQGAARTARIKQSRAQRYLERLERKVGVPLRTGAQHDLRLTDAGACLLRAGRRYLRRLNEAVSQTVGALGEGDATDVGSGALRTVRLAADGGPWDGFVDDLARHVPTLLPAIVNAAPEVSRELFERYRVDAVYTWDPFHEAERLTRPVRTYQVVDEPMWVALPRDHPSADEAVVSLTDLRDDRWIVGPGGAARQALVSACLNSGFEPRIHRVADSVSAARSLLWHTVSIALFSPLSLPPEGGTRFLVRPLRDGPRQQHVLTVDPSVVPDHLARTLRERLRASYHERARLANSRYADALDRHGERDEPSPSVAAPRSTGIRSDPEGRPSVPGTGSGEGECLIEPEDVTMLRIIDESGSLNRAAPVLLISQPALTRRLKRLERRLAMKLLVCGYRGTALTAAGRRLLGAVTEAEREFQLAARPLLDRMAQASSTPRQRSAPGAMSCSAPHLPADACARIPSLGDRPRPASQVVARDCIMMQ